MAILFVVALFLAGGPWLAGAGILALWLFRPRPSRTVTVRVIVRR